MASMLVTHHLIARALKKQRTSSLNTFSFTSIVPDVVKKKTMRNMARNLRVIKLLFTITVTFFLLWTPWVIVRIVRRIVFIPQMIWTTIQGVILISTTTNFFISLNMSLEFKKTVERLLRWKADEESTSTLPEVIHVDETFDEL